MPESQFFHPLAIFIHLHVAGIDTIMVFFWIFSRVSAMAFFSKAYSSSFGKFAVTNPSNISFPKSR